MTTKAHLHDIIIFTAKVEANLPKDKYYDIAAIVGEYLTLAKRAERYNIAACNRELTPREDKAQNKTDLRFLELCTSLGWKGKCNGDPRGFSLKILFPDESSNSWGGPQEGWGIPT